MENLEKKMIDEYEDSAPKIIINGCVAILVLCGLILGGTVLCMAFIDLVTK